MHQKRKKQELSGKPSGQAERRSMSAEKRMPVIFSGHGSPMLALENTSVTTGLRKIGERIVWKFGKPKAILVVSAHWYTKGLFVQTAEQPQQIYDMYGFPTQLYEFKYPVKGDPALGQRVCELLGDRVKVDDSWGIDHGTWTVLCHVFPKADVPVVQFSVSAYATREELYAVGKALAPLRDEGILIFASGNVVHNLAETDWMNPNGTQQTLDFNQAIIDRVLERDDQSVMDYEKIQNAAYAVPTPEHYLPLVYMLGAAEGEKAEVFNNHCELGSIAMTGFAFGL